MIHGHCVCNEQVQKDLRHDADCLRSRLDASVAETQTLRTGLTAAQKEASSLAQKVAAAQETEQALQVIKIV